VAEIRAFQVPSIAVVVTISKVPVEIYTASCSIADVSKGDRKRIREDYPNRIIGRDKGTKRMNKGNKWITTKERKKKKRKKKKKSHTRIVLSLTRPQQ
jgi:hypothetical protein